MGTSFLVDGFVGAGKQILKNLQKKRRAVCLYVVGGLETIIRERVCLRTAPMLKDALIV